MSSGANQVILRTGIGAVNDRYHLRVYTQDISGGIYESIYDNGWYNGRLIANCKLGFPISATSIALSSIRVYSISHNNTLQEQAYDANAGWYTAALTNEDYTVAAYSSVAATYLAGIDPPTIRVYAQSTDHRIQEFGWNENSNEWHAYRNLGPALPGTAIAVTSFPTSFPKPSHAIRVYFQDPLNDLIEMTHDSDTGWRRGSFSVSDAIPRTALAVSTTEDDSIHVYYGGSNNRILEKVCDANSGWYNGGFAQASIPGSKVAAVNWGKGSRLNLRVYLQQGTNVSAVSEYQWMNGSWSVGQAAIPPA